MSKIIHSIKSYKNVKFTLISLNNIYYIIINCENINNKSLSKKIVLKSELNVIDFHIISRHELILIIVLEYYNKIIYPLYLLNINYDVDYDIIDYNLDNFIKSRCKIKYNQLSFRILDKNFIKASEFDNMMIFYFRELPQISSDRNSKELYISTSEHIYSYNLINHKIKCIISTLYNINKILFFKENLYILESNITIYKLNIYKNLSVSLDIIIQSNNITDFIIYNKSIYLIENNLYIQKYNIEKNIKDISYISDVNIKKVDIYNNNLVILNQNNEIKNIFQVL